MPYISNLDRPPLDRIAEQVDPELTPGELNYLLTRIVMRRKPKTYFDFNSLIGTLECVKAELYRRVVAPYEDGKRVENGDVYGNL